MRGQTEKRARLAKVLDRKVEKLQDNRVEVTKKERKVTFKLPIPPRSGDVPMTVEHVAVSYGSLKVLKDVNFITRRGDRIVIVGRNGAGKSSMLRCLAGTQKSSKGVVKFGANVTVGYFAQENEQLDFDKTVLGNLENATVVTEVQRRSLLGAFGLKGSAAHQMPATLSGGERAKLALAILASSDANLLVVGRTDEQPRPGERGGPRRHDAQVEGHHRRGESRTRIRRDPGADARRLAARGVLRPLERRLHGPHRTALDAVGPEFTDFVASRRVPRSQ